MSERKVLNKYYPPNFDPSKIPRRRVPRDLQHKVRLMTPFSMRCETCGEYIYKGKKFNARKETVLGEQYLAINIYRFYIKCPRCAAEITFKTDPQNADYVSEHGASRNFEPWRDEGKERERVKGKRAEEEENNPIKKLENRTKDSKREMDVLDKLDEIRTANARLERVDVEGLEESLRAKRKLEEIEEAEEAEPKVDAEDEELARKLFRARDGARVKVGSHETSNGFTGLPLDNDEDELPVLDLTRPSLFATSIDMDAKVTNGHTPSSSTNTDAPPLHKTLNGISGMIARAKPTPATSSTRLTSQSSIAPDKPKTVSLLDGGYGTDSSDGD